LPAIAQICILVAIGSGPRVAQKEDRYFRQSMASTPTAFSTSCSSGTRLILQTMATFNPRWSLAKLRAVISTHLFRNIE
jgi:hypothetical protein